jgi:phosphatidylserine/phosphatidylglycerophosphate/cardiolipin synthase-like enzyme
MQFPTRTGNKVVFQLDGSAFFNTLDGLTKWVTGGKSGYIRMLYWHFNHETKLSDTAGTFESALKKVADSGKRVQLLMWRPEDLALSLSPEDSFVQKTWEDNVASIAALHGYKDLIAAYPLKRYRPSVTSTRQGSVHQKMAIFRRDNDLQVVVGGFNISKEYRDNPSHTRSRLHDTGMLVIGPSAVDVEDEWKTQFRTLTTTTDKVFAATAATLDEVTPVQRSEGSSTVTVVTSKGASEADIAGILRDRISAAKTSIFAENFQFFTEAVIDPIVARMTAPAGVQNLKVAVVFPLGRDHDKDDSSTTATRKAYARMALESARSWRHSTTDETADVYVLKSDGTEDPVPLSSSTITTVTKTDVAIGGKRYGLEKISRLAYPGSSKRPPGLPKRSKVQFYIPVRLSGLVREGENPLQRPDVHSIYVHSKLMIIDGTTVIIGSANFGERSMTLDHEICLVIDDHSVAQGLMKALFEHYGADAVKKWLEIEPYKALKQTVVSHGANRVALVPADPKDLVAPGAGTWTGWAKQLLLKS